MLAPSRIDRRGFLLGMARPHRVLELSCERLYMRYVDARASGRLPALVAQLARDVAAAHEVRVLHREWLDHEDFRTEIGRLLPGLHITE